MFNKYPDKFEKSYTKKSLINYCTLKLKKNNIIHSVSKLI